MYFYIQVQNTTYFVFFFGIFNNELDILDDITQLKVREWVRMMTSGSGIEKERVYSGRGVIQTLIINCKIINNLLTK